MRDPLESKDRMSKFYIKAEVAENNSPENGMFIRANTVPMDKSHAGEVASRNTKEGTTKQVIVFG